MNLSDEELLIVKRSIKSEIDAFEIHVKERNTVSASEYLLKLRAIYKKFK